MSVGTAALLAGLFVVPIILLALGHRLRRRSSTQRKVFWGALVGYLVAALAAMWVGMMPAAEWSDSDTVRGLLGFWGLILGPLVGAAAAIASWHRSDR
jgi:uncharacterized protein YqgC (DUF456 family)